MNISPAGKLPTALGLAFEAGRHHEAALWWLAQCRIVTPGAFCLGHDGAIISRTEACRRARAAWWLYLRFRAAALAY